MDFSRPYDHDEYINFLQDFLPREFESEKRELRLPFGSVLIKKVTELGRIPGYNLGVFEVYYTSADEPRVSLSREIYRLIQRSDYKSALVVFVSSKSNSNYRLSLITFNVSLEGKRVRRKYSNPRRFSFYLGKNAAIKTPTRQLEGRITDFIDLKKRFSIEVVTKEFFTQIGHLFNELSGGKRDKTDYEKGLLEIPGESKLKDEDAKAKKQQFAVRLIGRLIFCWFLKQKKSMGGKQLIPEKILSSHAVNSYESYQHEVIEPLFFELLNKQKRTGVNLKEFEKDIPFLNGSLFTAHNDDFYEDQPDPNLIVPNDWFKKFFKHLEEYHFTIDENSTDDAEISIDPEMLGRIFENLLAEINPETGENARKNTGSFYTPREIVEYMTVESLKAYINTKTSIKDEKLEALFTPYSEPELNEKEKSAILDAVFNMKIIDPAVGSGAFPMAILQKSILLLEKADPEGTKWKEKILNNLVGHEKIELANRIKHYEPGYIRKWGIIKYCIYGVDIQSIAIDIAKLRFFLSLIVDEVVIDDKVNRDIEPLPNLEFNFICANTLINFPAKNKIIESSECEAKLNKLEEIRKTYIITHNLEKKEGLISKFRALQADIDKITEEKFSLFESWHPFDNKKANFFDPELMFGVKNGFDIAIANPPYIQLQNKEKINEKDRQAYINQNFETYKSSGDIYCLFYEKGVNLLNNKSVLTFITSNKWMKAGYGDALFKHIAKNNVDIKKLIDFNGHKIFDTATVNTNILIMQKQKKSDTFKAVKFKKDFQKDENINDYINKNAMEMDQKEFGEPGWFIGTKAERNLKKKIEAISTPLRKWDLKIYFGIKTGLNEAFIIDQKTRDRLIKEDPKSAKIIKPILRGRDIKRYEYTFANQYIIATFPTLKLDIEKYPAIKKYFLNNFDIRQLKQSGDKYPKLGFNARKKNSNKWFETQDNIGYYKEFENEKVVWKRIGSKIKFSYDNSGMYAQDSTCIMTGGKLKFLTAVLNSTLGNYLLQDSPRTGTGDLILSVQAINPILIPQITPVTQSLVNRIESLVNKIIAAKKAHSKTNIKTYEKKIDQLVYELYGLKGKNDAIRIIEGKAEKQAIETQYLLFKEKINKLKTNQRKIEFINSYDGELLDLMFYIKGLAKSRKVNRYAKQYIDLKILDELIKIKTIEDRIAYFKSKSKKELDLLFSFLGSQT